MCTCHGCHMCNIHVYNIQRIRYIALQSYRWHHRVQHNCTHVREPDREVLDVVLEKYNFDSKCERHNGSQCSFGSSCFRAFICDMNREKKQSVGHIVCHMHVPATTLPKPGMYSIIYSLTQLFIVLPFYSLN